MSLIFILIAPFLVVLSVLAFGNTSITLQSTLSPPGWVYAPNVLLDLDFANQRYWNAGHNAGLDQLITTTRATSETCTTAGGGLITVGSNTPCITDQGLQNFLAATNLLLQSPVNTTGSNWSATRGTINGAAATSPDGTTDAATLIEDNTATNTHQMQQSVTKAASAIAYTYSIYAKANGRTRIDLQLDDAAGNGAIMVCDLSGQQVGVNTAGVGTAFTTLGQSATVVGAWTRCSMSATSNTATTVRAVVFLDNGSGTAAKSNSYTGDNASGVTIFGGQLEALALSGAPSAYVPTTTATATRNTDIHQITIHQPTFGIGSSAGNNPSYTAFLSWRDMVGTATAKRALDRNGSGLFGLDAQSGGNARTFVTGGVTVTTAFSPAINTNYTLAASISGVGAVRMSLNNATIVTGSGTGIATDTGFTLGSTTAGASNIDGAIRRFIVMPGVLGDASVIGWVGNGASY